MAKLLELVFLVGYVEQGSIVFVDEYDDFLAGLGVGSLYQALKALVEIGL